MKKKPVKNPRNFLDEKEADDLHEMFTGRPAASKFEVNLHNMKTLTQLGKVAAIEYTARKHDDKQQVTYRHSFKKKPLLLTNGKELVIIGDFEINERGIV